MYIIKKTDKKITSLFDNAWDSANIAEISQNNWSQFEKAPKTTAKLLYSDFGIHIRKNSHQPSHALICVVYITQCHQLHLNFR